MCHALLTTCALLLSAALGLASALAQQYQPSEQKCERQDGAQTEEFQRTVVITAEDDPEVFAGDRFSLGSTLKAILSTAVAVREDSEVDPETQIALASSEAEQIALLTTLIRSFRNLDRANNGVVNNATFRPNEAALDAS